MSTLVENQVIAPPLPFPADWSMAELQYQLGDIPPERIRLVPHPGYASVDDVQRIQETEGRLYELEVGVLVEKPKVWYESYLTLLLSHALQDYLNEHDLGILLGADGAIHILPNVVKIPDISFINWSRFPKQKLPRRPIPHLVPDLVVEVLSDTNTPREMQLKLERYIEAGVLLVWYIDPAIRSATAYTSVHDAIRIESTGRLDGGNVLPGFALSLASLFEKADRARPEFEATDTKDHS